MTKVHVIVSMGGVCNFWPMTKKNDDLTLSNVPTTYVTCLNTPRSPAAVMTDEHRTQ